MMRLMMETIMVIAVVGMLILLMKLNSKDDSSNPNSPEEADSDNNG